MSRRAWVLGALIVLVGCSSAWADLALPRKKPAKSKAMKLVIETDVNAREPRLVMPANSLAGIDVGMIEPGDDDARAEAPARPVFQTVVIGMALSLALACGGVWLVRRNRTSGTNLVVLLAAGLALTSGAIVWANAPPPIRRPKPTTLFNGNVSVELEKNTTTIRLILPPNSLAPGAETPTDRTPPSNPKPE